MSIGFWTADRVDTLRTMAAGNYSANQIAFQIGDGITRNAVCGKAYRISVQLSGSNRGARTNRTSRKGIPKPRRHTPNWAVPKSIAQDVVELVIEAPTAANVTLVDLEPHHCRWPVSGEPGPAMMFCGKTVLDAGPYCGWHARIAYMPGRR